MKVLINFADNYFRNQQKYNTKTGYKVGKFDKVIEFSPDDIPASYKEQHEEIFSVKRGYGLWLWKPYFIVQTLKSLNEGDYLFYCDSGAYFLKPIDLLISVMEHDKQEIMCYEIPLLECQWTSESCIKIMECQEARYLMTPQRCAGYILIKKTEYSVKMMEEYLHTCENYECLSGGHLGESCLAHREDQSVWSLITKKYGIEAYRDPSQYGILPRSYIRYAQRFDRVALAGYSNQEKSTYPTVIFLYRKGKDYQIIPRVISRMKLIRNLYFSSKI